VDKVWVLLLSTWPFLAFFAWAGWWLITDRLRESRLTRAAVVDLGRERRGDGRWRDGDA
jgi:hypothetical protein